MNRSLSMFLWFGLIIAASLVLYHTSDRVHELNQQLAELNTSIDAERESIHVLKADWVYLTNPDRVGKIAKRHLAVRPSNPQQMMAMNEINQMLPTRTEALQNVAVTATPIASVRTTLAAMPPIRPATMHSIKTARASTSKPTQVASADMRPRSPDHMIMLERTASAAPVGDSIGTLIASMDQRQ